MIFKICTVVCSITLLLFCNSNHKTILGDMIYKYHVYQFKGNNREELGILLLEKSPGFLSLISFGQTTIKWTYNLNNIKLEETTLAEDDGKSFSLHPPRKSIFLFTEIAPFPSIDLPPEIGTTAKIKLNIVKYPEFENGILNGKIIHQEVILKKVIDTTINNNHYHECFYSIGKNLNLIKELGYYLIETWFVNEKGFVIIKYTKPNGDIILFVLD